MKIKTVTVSCVLAISLAGVSPVRAMDDGSPEAIATDVLIARPACLVATVVGSAVFVLALPFAAMSKSTKKVGQTLVGGPAKATFTRELGDFTGLTEASRKTTGTQAEAKAE